MSRYSWLDLIKEELPITVSPYIGCSVRVQDALVRALKELGYALTEARCKCELRWLHLVYLQYMFMQIIAMCDEEFADMIKGKTPEELEKERYRLINYLEEKWLIRYGDKQ